MLSSRSERDGQRHWLALGTRLRLDLADPPRTPLSRRPPGMEREPLHQAAALDRPEAVALLVSLGFPVNDRRGSPLHTAALFGRLGIVKLLVELGADPTAEIDARPGQFTPSDRTPLGWARYMHQHEVVAYLTRLTSTGPDPPASSAT
jgi:ankyrin repeat protein